MLFSIFITFFLYKIINFTISGSSNPLKEDIQRHLSRDISIYFREGSYLNGHVINHNPITKKLYSWAYQILKHH
jgi:hypothetical protein